LVIARSRAVVAKTWVRSAQASAVVGKSRAAATTLPAPLAIVSAFGFGQPSRGATSRIRSRPKFHIARAAAPMFSPICGATSTMTGVSCIGSLPARPAG
jgi:hypothetical protein